MFPYQYPVPQSDPPLSPRETLPTMYDLPSEDPEEPGKPDEFHDLQPQLLSQTFCPPQYFASQMFSGSDMNLYKEKGKGARSISQGDRFSCSSDFGEWALRKRVRSLWLINTVRDRHSYHLSALIKETNRFPRPVMA